MSVADPTRRTAGPEAATPAGLTTPPVVEPKPPAAGSEPPAAVAPGSWSTPEWRTPGARRPAYRVRQDGLTQRTGQLVAAAFAIAFVLCPAVEPLPNGPSPDYPVVVFPVDIAALVSIVAAVVVLWRGGRNGARLGVAAGVLMAVETVLCPVTGHHVMGWWTWAQAALSLFVLGTSAALMTRGAAAADRAANRRI